MCSYSMGLVFEARGVFCIAVVVFDFTDEGAAGWGDVTLFVVVEGAGVWRQCWSVPSLYACGSRAYGFGWLWLSKERVFYFIFGFTFPFIYEGVRCVRILWDWFLKHVVF
ncbi:hypothetical protein MCQ_00529 [Candidatus Bartonella washoeensis Sb944nv]|uniref:Uncharacterized protein n=2 Tax=Candidatus Bartonella washoeensis TaxID=186739 RepID=J0Q4D5_9HYPH|nr:hypothetical protein MCQ_00529 [Bartonella washoeensis Sb944nv]